jgi:hypothetical protein
MSEYQYYEFRAIDRRLATSSEDVDGAGAMLCAMAEGTSVPIASPGVELPVDAPYSDLVFTAPQAGLTTHLRRARIEPAPMLTSLASLAGPPSAGASAIAVATVWQHEADLARTCGVSW